MNRKEPTLIIVRRTLAEVNAALAGVTFVATFARFKVSIAISNGERIPSFPCGRWDLLAIVKTVHCACCEEEPGS